ncbi:feather keratin 1-like [Pyrgilauda ruficollis]|uniref:feather keratin 1-like n=1 Tax=Pyrgilauda ruficollis TaxID=221976 RepID=UPI001B886D47|nr:feather keratin 1-like [Pyrgilauda ruficollis]
MACNNICRPCGPTPLANSCNEPCALQCQDSRVVIQPSPVMVTLPGPIMTSFPQSTAVGSTSSAAVGAELSVQGQPISGGFGGFGLGYGRHISGTRFSNALSTSSCYSQGTKQGSSHRARPFPKDFSQTKLPTGNKGSKSIGHIPSLQDPFASIPLLLGGCTRPREGSPSPSSLEKPLE